jgi:hypothetical protein
MVSRTIIDPTTSQLVGLPMPLLLLLMAGLGGCATHAERLIGPRNAFYANDLPHAQEQLSKLSAKPKSDSTVVELDLAMVDLLAGNPAGAEARLRQVRDKWDHLEQKSMAEEVTSYLTDDGRRAYSGEDYEKLLVRVFLTLSSMMNDGVDASSYSLQAMDKHDEMRLQAEQRWEQELPESYCVPPVVPYLRGVIREATLSNYDDALRSYEHAQRLLPDSPLLALDVERVTHGVHSPAGSGVVYVIALVGRGPYKVEVEEHATQQALLIADRIVSAVGKYSVPPTLAPVKIPQIVSPPKPFDLLGVEVNGVAVATTLPITDLHQLATETYAYKLPEVMARTVARRIVKKGAVYAAKDQLEASSTIASLAMDAAGVLWEATESADTRCWGLLPREIQILRVELPAGTHQFNLEPVRGGTAVGRGVPCNVEVVDGGNTYVLSYWPDLQPIGEVLVSPLRGGLN